MIKKIRTTNKILFTILVIVIVINLVANIFIFWPTNEEKKILSEKYKLIEKYVNWREGNSYILHNPFYDEALEFIEKDNYHKDNVTIEKAKAKGINCSYVSVITGDQQTLLSLIGFNTVDKGMVYFEMDTVYRVKPELGERYSNCVLDYNYNFMFNDTIEEIIHFW